VGLKYQLGGSIRLPVNQLITEPYPVFFAGGEKSRSRRYQFGPVTLWDQGKLPGIGACSGLRGRDRSALAVTAPPTGRAGFKVIVK
jgi:hypothetical protein